MKKNVYSKFMSTLLAVTIAGTMIAPTAAFADAENPENVEEATVVDNEEDPIENADSIDVITQAADAELTTSTSDAEDTENPNDSNIVDEPGTNDETIEGDDVSEPTSDAEDASPVSIEYTPVVPIEFMQGKDSTTQIVFEYDDNYTAIGEKERFDYYFLNIRFGDKLAITYDDETKKTYTADWDYEYEGGSLYFVNDNDENDKILAEDYGDCPFSFRYDQYEEHWLPGNTYYPEFVYNVDDTYLTTTFPVKITENPIAAFSYTPASPIISKELEDGWEGYDYDTEKSIWYYSVNLNQEGDKCAFEYKDGTKKTYEAKSFTESYYDEDDDTTYEYEKLMWTNVNDETDQEDIWEFGIYAYTDQVGYWAPGEHPITVHKDGFSTIIPVTTVESIESDQVTVSGISDKNYTGNAVKVAPVVKRGSKTLKEGTDYTVTYNNNINVGTATVEITGKGNYWGTIEKTFKINPSEIASKIDISKKAVTLSAASYTYDGKAKTPTVTVQGLSNGTDYTVAYKNNTNTGTATVTITGNGSYTGTITKTFTITKVAQKMTAKAKTKAVKKAKVAKKKQVVKNAITVKNAQGTVTYKKASGSKRLTINSKTGKITVKKGTKKGTYKMKVKVSANGGSNYKAASKTVTVKVKVK